MKAKKGLSNAVTALILVIASVIITLVVVGYVYGLLGAFGGVPTVSQVGTGCLTYSSTNNEYILTFTLRSTGTVTIQTVQIVGYTKPVSENIQLTVGTNQVTIDISSSDVTTQFLQGSTYTVTVDLSSGQTALVSVVYE